MVNTWRRFYSVYFCCAEVFILECLSGKEFSDFKVVKKFNLPVEELYLWKPKYPVFVCLPSNMFFLKQVELICPSDVPCELAVAYEYDKNIPFPSHTVYWNWTPVDQGYVFKPAIIFGIRTDVIDKWLCKVSSPLDKTVAVTPYIASCYNLIRYLDLEDNLREEDKISLLLYCDSHCTDLIIVGQNPSQDLLRTFTRVYGNVSLVWDIKETLEMYFARFSARVGDVPLSKEIKKIFLIRSGELQKENEWETVFAEQVGVQIEEFPFDRIISAFFHNDSLLSEKNKAFCLCLGLAMMSLPINSALEMLIPLEVERKSFSFSYVDIVLQTALLLGASALVGGMYLNVFLPIKQQKNEFTRILTSYKEIGLQKKRLQKKRDLLLAEIKSVNSRLSSQYSWESILEIISSSMQDIDTVKIDEFSGKIFSEEANKMRLTVSLKISARDYDVLNEFIRNLRQIGKLKRVSPVTSRFDEEKQNVEMLLVVEI